jgi:hypothetical protein
MLDVWDEGYGQGGLPAAGLHPVVFGVLDVQ